MERNKNFLLKEFEIASNKDLTEFELENVNQIIKLLKQAAIDRNNSLDIIDSFQYLLESSESTLFNVFPNPTKLQSLITSIVTNNVIKTNFNKLENILLRVIFCIKYLLSRKNYG